MTSYPSMMKTKRKDLDDVNGDFSDFSLSAPAKKIRRLDAELPPIIEEELPDVRSQFHQISPQFGASDGFQPRLSEPLIEELPPSPSNEERAIVLFNPLNSNPWLSSAPPFFIHSDLVSSFKNHGIWRTNSTCYPSVENEEDSKKADKNLAVVPWVPSQQSQLKFTANYDASHQSEDLNESMESDEMEVEQAMMDSEDNNALSVDQRQANWMSSEDLTQQQWQQQHCMIPRVHQNMTSPVVWYR